MRCRPRGSRDALAAQIGKLLDTLVFAHPKLRRGEFDRIDEEHLALTARRKVRDHRSGRQHVDAATCHGREQLDAGLEFLELRVETVLRPCPEMVCQPYLSIDGQSVKIA